jgi:hypothetical protein
VVRTLLPDFDPNPGPAPACGQAQQETTAAAAGAVAIVHDFRAQATSPQWFETSEVDVPVLFTDHRTARGMVQNRSATLRALTPSWGFLRVFDARTGKQVATFDDLPHVQELPAPEGFWSIHNTEVVDVRGFGDIAYSSWYTHGVVALDLRPLNNRSGPRDPRFVGQFVPAGAPSPTPLNPSGIPVVWGVVIRESDGLIFVSDMSGGLWIVRATGPAAP